MQIIAINEPELCYLGLFRMALSETNLEERLTAITAVRHDVIGGRLELLPDGTDGGWVNEPENANLALWVAKTSVVRHEATHMLADIQRRYEDRNERKLNVAEHIGKLVYLSIQDQKNQGLQVRGGILEQVSDIAKENGIRGARDKDTLRKIGNAHRGVVHLGIAMDYCEEAADPALNGLHVAEHFRKARCENAPQKTKDPYVDQGDQISFAYKSDTWGPRFRDRGLPFTVG